MTTESDEQLAARAQRERGAAYQAILARADVLLDGALPRRLAGRLRAKVGASDVHQDALISVAAHLDDFHDQGPGSFERWVRTIATNHERSAGRHHGAARRDATREVSLPASGVASAPAARDPTPSVRFAAAELVSHLLAGLEAKSPAQAQAFRLVRLEDRSFVEAAALLGKSPDAIRKLVERAEKFLRGVGGEADVPAEA